MTPRPNELRRRIAAFESKYPIPQVEKERMRDRRWILQHAPKNGVGAEIGVFRGWFAEIICDALRPSRLYLIDPWTRLGETFGWGKEYTAFDTLKTADARAEAELRTALYPQVETVTIEGSYPQCRDRIAEPLDFAYIDASHKYDRTLWELTSLDAQMKPEGVILGDDWRPDPRNQHHGVFQAVTEFVKTRPWELVAAGRGGQWAIRRSAPR